MKRIIKLILFLSLFIISLFFYKFYFEDSNIDIVQPNSVNESSIDEELQQGSRIGMIRFGSRADLYFENYQPLIKVNQKTIAGETLIAKK